MNNDPNEYVVTTAGNVYARPKSNSSFEGPLTRGSWRPAYPQMDLPAVDPRSFMDRAVEELLLSGPVSFPVSPNPGDARRKRKGLTPSDVQRLIDANPDFEQQILDMYMPGPGLPKIKRALGDYDELTAQGIPVEQDPRLPMSQDAFRQYVLEQMRRGGGGQVPPSQMPPTSGPSLFPLRGV